MIPERLAQLRHRMEKACRSVGRPLDAVTLVAIGKGVPPAALAEALAARQTHFGENYVQEALPKIAVLAALRPRTETVWHFTGPIQSNKTADVATHFDWVHGVDRTRIARRLSDQRPSQGPPLNVCVQINISGESQKSGVAPEAAPDLCRAVAALPGLRLRGLMAIPAPAHTGQDPRHAYRQLRELFESLQRQGRQRWTDGGVNFDTLSAGMSDDFEQAIAEGSTLVRIGTALFGASGAKERGVRGQESGVSKERKMS
ncbi:MAG: YggS family pyridoxal phosphate-dependent enzyme [Nevskiales bacterium]|nr:YggS family pyridoxal phosphate-dependent enzyme [Nevskiales bacterium]